jgi:hypothetical protein
MISRVSYNVTQGVDWDRLVVVKDRRTRRVIRPIECWARIKTGELTVAQIRTQVTSEGAILLSLTAAETKALPAGDLEFDVIATHNKRQSLAYGSFTTYPGRFRGETITRPVVRGVLKVSPLDTVTSLEQETQVEIRFKKGQDYRLMFSWKDSAGEFIGVKDAYMQAKNGDGSAALDIRWFNEVPDESAIVNLPGPQRGYLAPAENASIELHISDANTVAPGVYRYDIFVQEEGDDWMFLAGGALVVEESVSTRPE